MDLDSLQNKARQGDQKAVEELFEVLTSRFRLFVHHKIRNKTDAEEIVQEALTAIYAEYKEMTFTTSFSAWACKVLDNRILNYLRKKQHESRRIDPRIDQNSDSIDISVAAHPDLKRKLRLCFEKICRRNLRYARILNFHYQGYKTSEICSRLDLKPETLYSALSKARSMLEDCLEKGDITK